MKKEPPLFEEERGGSAEVERGNPKAGKGASRLGVWARESLGKFGVPLTNLPITLTMSMSMSVLLLAQTQSLLLCAFYEVST